MQETKIRSRILCVVIAVALVIAAICVTVAVQNKKLSERDSIRTQELENMQAQLETVQAQLETVRIGLENRQTELENVLDELENAQEQLGLLEEERQKNAEALIDLITRVDYHDQPVYVIGHQSPDSDTVGASVGMAWLLNSLGVPAEARITAKLNPETGYAYSKLGCSTPEVLEDATGKQLWLVDHSASTQMVKSAGNVRIVGIVDHHGIGDVENTDMICVLSCPAGSTCSIIFKLCETCGLEMPAEIASALLVGLLSDSSNMKSNNVTSLDEDAFDKLKILSGIADPDMLYNSMLKAHYSYEGMDDREIFFSDYKEYEHNGVTYGIGCVKVGNGDLEPAMAERMQHVIREEMENGCEFDFLLYSISEPDYVVGYMGYIGKDAEFVDALMESAFGENSERDGEYLVFHPCQSRKAETVPAINRSLDNLSRSQDAQP